MTGDPTAELRVGIAVFTRNHKGYMEDAAEHPDRITAFRSSVRWVRAEKAVRKGVSIPLYVALIEDSESNEDGVSRVVYEARLCEVVLDPQHGDPRTDKLWPDVCSPEEGLWEKNGVPQVRTLYGIRSCQKTGPFAITRLLKVSDGKPLSAGFKYSYSVVLPYEPGDSA